MAGAARNWFPGSPPLHNGTPSEPQGRTDNFCAPCNDAFYASRPYRELDTRRAEIRLLRIHPNAPHKRASNGSSALSCVMEDNVQFSHSVGSNGYCVLSYCAGDPKNTTPIFINEREFNAFANLEYAVECVRSYWKTFHPREDLLLWTDQICINQSDPVERSKQVQLMREIYKRAKTTFVCLSSPQVKDCLSWIPDVPPMEIESVALARRQDAPSVRIFKGLLQDFMLGKTTGDDGQTASSTNEPGDMPAFLPSLESFIKSPWWRRAWVYQEFLSFSDVRFLAGTKSISWGQLSPMLDFICHGAEPFIASIRANLEAVITRTKAELESKISDLRRLIETKEATVEKYEQNSTQEETEHQKLKAEVAHLEKRHADLCPGYLQDLHTPVRECLKKDWSERYNAQSRARREFLYEQVRNSLSGPSRETYTRYQGNYLYQLELWGTTLEMHQMMQDPERHISRIYQILGPVFPDHKNFTQRLMHLDAVPSPAFRSQDYCKWNRFNMIQTQVYHLNIPHKDKKSQAIPNARYEKWKQFETNFNLRVIDEQGHRDKFIRDARALIASSSHFQAIRRIFSSIMSESEASSLTAEGYFVTYLRGRSIPELIMDPTSPHGQKPLEPETGWQHHNGGGQKSLQLMPSTSQSFSKSEVPAESPPTVVPPGQAKRNSLREGKIQACKDEISKLQGEIQALSDSPAEVRQVEDRLEVVGAIQNYLEALDTSALKSMAQGKASFDRTGMELKMLLQHSRHCLSSDPRDRVYAFLGLAPRRTYKIVPSYEEDSGITRVLIDAAKAIICHDKTLELLSHTHRGRTPG